MHSIIWRIARTPPYRLRVPSGAASALGNKLAGQKKFNTTPSAIVAAKIKGGRVITSGLSGRLSCIAFSQCGLYGSHRRSLVTRSRPGTMAHHH